MTWQKALKCTASVFFSNMHGPWANVLTGSTFHHCLILTTYISFGDTGANRADTDWSIKCKTVSIGVCVFSLKLLPKALNVAMCSQMLPGWSGWGCHTRASTSCLRQRHGISDGFTSTVNRYWWLPRFTCRETDRRGRCRCELKLFLDVLLPRSMLGGSVMDT